MKALLLGGLVPRLEMERLRHLVLVVLRVVAHIILALVYTVNLFLPWLALSNIVLRLLWVDVVSGFVNRVYLEIRHEVRGMLRLRCGRVVVTGRAVLRLLLLLHRHVAN